MRARLHAKAVTWLGQYLLLADWSNTTRGIGSYIFLAGKGLGIAGRVIGVLFVIAAIVGSIVSPAVLLLLGYGAGFAAVVALAVEGSARLLMLVGNAISAYGRQPDS